MSDTKQILSPYFKSIVDQDRLSIVICDLEKPLKLSQRGFEYEDSSDHRLVCSGFIAQYRLYFTQ